jgi:hypothetical protein
LTGSKFFCTNVVLIRTIKQGVKAPQIHIHYQQLHSGCWLIWEWLVFMTRPNKTTWGTH